MSVRALSEEWLALPPEATTLEKVDSVLRHIGDESWITAAVTDRVVDNVDVERAMLALGLEKTNSAVERSKRAMVAIGAHVEDDEDEFAVKTEEELWHSSLTIYFEGNATDELLCRLRAVLLDRLDKLDTYVEMHKKPVERKENTGDEEDEGWGFEDEAGDDEDTGESPSTQLLPLSTFLRRPLLQTALYLASNGHFEVLGILLRRHARELGRQRMHILQSIPTHIPPSDFQALLPSVDSSSEVETQWPDTPWRETPDWTETAECTSAFQSKDVNPAVAACELHTAVEVLQWYRDRINQADNLGLTDVAYALVQHGASQGVPDLDELGEELGLLARLVYDAPQSEDSMDEDWSLSRWRTLEPSEVLKAYLTNSTQRTIADNVRSLAMPYLYVLEARAERVGKPDPGLVNRLFYDYILQTPLELTAAIFDASKPTLSFSERLIKKDEDMARLSLACLYGSDELDSWQTMSRIFECLPAWDEINEDERDEADMTLLSLGDFVAPSTSRPKCSAQELLIFFTPLPFSALSRIVDVLDVHLESGEILSRWNVPAPLRWFLQSANDEGQQRAWATRMARQAGNGGEEPESEDEWLELLDDMLKLVGGGEGALRGAFGLLSKEEVTRIFFSGLLSSGNFKVAKSVLRKARTPYLSDLQIIEEQVLASSREFYDNATSGNLHQGDMKLAYDCLTVAKESSVIQKEREFIEATSRICSFNVYSRQGIPIAPIEIRLVKDRLGLVARVLASTEDAYKHSSVILDLVYKLGYQDDITAEVKTLAMLADAALSAEDFTRAAETVERMVDRVRKLPTTEDFKDAREVCWHSCFQLGRQSEFDDVEKKMSLLGHALEICPPEHLLDVLLVWRKLEGETLPARRDKVTSLKEKRASRKRDVPSSTTESIRTRLHDLNLGAMGAATGISATDAAARAGRTLKNVAANFPFSMRGRQGEDARSSTPESPGHHLTHEVSTQAKQAFARGIGWLIGDE
ncbi:hypothetical protein M422DRAFT_167113 [Sphaerobolus stellatus SS14]|uniref:Sec39 domain-containing protein n=1 Tax=Sphaerobolus stellatus (strain SS14) TaxID=990650 RepID=A0A0C9VDL3_SPHS4|nr:hypothetical protein M422DRAFT_167113 [Sphaerobolus stellatus SS14]